jgi:hypothetical protein
VTASGSGVARIEMEYEDLEEDERKVLIEGTVTSGTMTQPLEYALYVRGPFPPDEFEPDPYDLQVHEYDQDLDFSKDETWAGRAYFEGEPLASSWLNCYLATDFDLMAWENVTTDASGEFSLDFRTPQKGHGPGGRGTAYYVAPAPEGDDHFYERDTGGLLLGESRWPLYHLISLWEYCDLFRSDDMTLLMDEPASGSTMEVTLEHPDTGPGWEAFVYLGYDYDQEGEELVPEWTYWTKNRLSSWSAGNGGGAYSEQCRYEDGVWKATMVIPENVPSDGIFLWARIHEVGTYDNDRTYMADEDDLEARSTEKVLVGIILVLVTAGVAIVITRRQNRPLE